jgi:hypothetical protein
VVTIHWTSYDLTLSVNSSAMIPGDYLISTLYSKSFQFQCRRDLPGSDLTALVNEGEHRAMVGNEGPFSHQRPQFSLDKAID